MLKRSTSSTGCDLDLVQGATNAIFKGMHAPFSYLNHTQIILQVQMELAVGFLFSKILRRREEPGLMHLAF